MDLQVKFIKYKLSNMSESILSILPNLSVGVASVVVLYLSYVRSLKSIDERDRSFREFVNANNHASVEVMTQCRDQIRESADNIRANTELQKMVLDKLSKC